MKGERVPPGPRSWLLLIHNLPSRPLYLRARIRRRLAAIGAVSLKRSVYALPQDGEGEEQLRQIADGAETGGGEAHICIASFLDATTDQKLIETSRRDREKDWTALAGDVRETLVEQTRAPASSLPASGAEKLARLARRFEDLTAIDFFGAPGREDARAAVRDLEHAVRRRAQAAGRRTAAKTPRATAWVTRRGVLIDRIASAWLIRRFLDPRARFRFIDPSEPRRPGELRFDMPGGDFSHEGDACTFETLARRHGLDDSALLEIAEIVHDIDLKDGKFGRREAAGIERVLSGILVTTADDEERLERGFRLFEELYGAFRSVGARKEDRP